jgi:hypothetical protein
VSAWPLRGKWTPKDTWNRFVKSYKEGEFRVGRATRQGNMLVTQLYVYGGVDFSRIAARKLTGADVTARRPAMGTAVQSSLSGPAGESGGPLWLGGWSTERPRSFPDPPPASPLTSPVFYAATSTPVLAWLIVAGLLLARRRETAG